LNGYGPEYVTNIVKEYGILKPALMHHRDFRDFMKSLDEVLNEDDIDDVFKRLENRENKSK
jgi:RNA binding exosome subunit